MTSSTDVMVASHKTTNHKMANRHVTIGDSTITIVSPPITPDTPEQDGSHSFTHTITATSSTTNTTGDSIDRYTEDLHSASTAYLTKSTSNRTHLRQPLEEYYDVLRPEPRDQTLESRDNPFLPGGELSREAEDLLSRATIIRDHFYLNEEEKRTLRQQQQEQEKQQRSGKHVQIVENPDDIARARAGSHPSTSPPETVEERISPQLQANNLAAAAPASSPNGDDTHQLRPKENGRFKDTNAASDNDRQAVPDGENLAGHTETAVSGPGDLQVREADKKKRNKCCTIM